MKRKLWTVLAVMAMVSIILSGCSLPEGEDLPADGELYNVAFGKNTTTSSNHPRYPGELAVDGVWNVRESRWLSEIGAKPPYWIEIDLAGTFVLERAEVWSGNVGSPDLHPISDFELHYWSEGQWKTIPDAVVENNEDELVVLTFTEPVITDKVRLYSEVQPPEIDGFSGVRLRDILIYGMRVN